MRILLFGGNGQLGTELRRGLAQLGELVVATRSGAMGDGTACETADFDRLETLAPLIARLAPDVVVNAAAYTAVDRAEDEVDAAFRANAQAPQRIADACARRDALLLHFSTDYVFDGHGTRPYREDDPTAPLGVYGASKLAGEQAVQASGARHLIVRTAWVYAAHGNNFLRTMLKLAGERDELRIVADQVGSPTSAAVIAQSSLRILQQPFTCSGTWHLTAAGQTSWCGFAEAIIDAAHAHGLIARRPRIVPITTAEYPTAAARPAYSVLDTGKLQRDFGFRPTAWQDGLGKVLGRIRQIP